MFPGLSQQEVERRRKHGQGNVSGGVSSRPYLHIVRKNVFTFVNMVLLTIGVLLVLLGSPSDATTTAGLVVMNVLVGLVQEVRAKRKLDHITLLTRPRVTVIREGQEHAVDASELVLGDIVSVTPGDQIVCDGRILSESHVEVDESLLTGESDYVPKQNGDTVFSGSFCVSGSALYEATQVGKDSLANVLTAKARRFRISVTPLQRDVNTIVRSVSIACAVLAVPLIARAVQTDMPVIERVQIAAVVMGAIPQGLIFLVTLTYALGAVRLAGRGVLVQQNNAVESLSNITVLCMDKTGTLTTNCLRYADVAPHGINRDEFTRLLGDFVASSTNHNRTSDALQAALPGQTRSVVEEVPFASAHKWSGLILIERDQRSAYILGAQEIVLPDLASHAPDLARQLSQWSEQGLRVLLFAHTLQAESLRDASGQPCLPDGIAPLGLVALTDDLRPEARATLEGFARTGIELKIISGDNPRTVAALAAQAGFEVGKHLSTGSELEALNQPDFARATVENAIFGRIKPDQKERLIDALRERGAYVAMIGDGVNDVPALKKAHIGIAMHSGSAAARNVADIVLLNDSFAALPTVFQEGQRIVNGLLDTMRLLLSRTVYVLLIISLTWLVNAPFPFLPTQDALDSFLTAGLPPLLLTLWAVSGRPPRKLLGAVGSFVFPAAATIALAGTGVYLYALHATGSDLETSRSALVTTVVGCGAVLILFAMPPLNFWATVVPPRRDWRAVELAVGVAILLALVVLIPPLRRFFDLTLLAAPDYVLIAFVVCAWALVLRRVGAYAGGLRQSQGETNPDRRT